MDLYFMFHRKKRPRGEWLHETKITNIQDVTFRNECVYGIMKDPITWTIALRTVNTG